MARLRDLLRITAAVILTFGLTVASIPTAAALGSPAAAPGFGTVVTADAWRGALNGDVRRLIAEGRADDARGLLRRRLEDAICA